MQRSEHPASSGASLQATWRPAVPSAPQELATTHHRTRGLGGGTDKPRQRGLHREGATFTAGRGGDPGERGPAAHRWAGPVARIPAPQRVGGHSDPHPPPLQLAFLLGNLTKSFQNAHGKARVVNSKVAMERSRAVPARTCLAYGQAMPGRPGEGTDHCTGAEAPGGAGKTSSLHGERPRCVLPGLVFPLNGVRSQLELPVTRYCNSQPTSAEKRSRRPLENACEGRPVPL